MKPRNAIIGFCTNMPVERVNVFCKSAGQVHDADSAEIILVTNEPDLYRESLRGLDVGFVSTPCDFGPSIRVSEKIGKRFAVHCVRLIGGTWLDRRLMGGAIGRLMPTLWEAWCHPFAARWHACARILSERPDIEKVFFSDVKDVLVQSDCFASLEADQVQLFLEGPLTDSR